MKHTGCLGSRKVDDCCDNGRNNHPQELEPIEKWDADKRWFPVVVEGRPQHNDKRDDEE
jgi:hypothetical protein